MLHRFTQLVLPEGYSKKTPYINITCGAYPEHNAKFIQFATEWIDQSDFSEIAKNLFTLCMINSLERCSYTSKSGQYLSWDSRSEKIIDVNRRREEAGKKPLAQHTCRKVIEDSRDAVADELRHVLSDLETIQGSGYAGTPSAIHYTQGSALFQLPQIADGLLKGVITSPPYCNRYDYTRTYALELAYLGVDEKGIKEMRQALLSCTVENKSKVEALREHYTSIGAGERFHSILSRIRTNPALQEVLQALEMRKAHGDLNNDGVLRMVEGYFTELAFLYGELYRICQPGAVVAFVNDNVRYGGEVIPVDYLSTNLAEQFGFTPVKVYCLEQLKGNSSQQMKKYGRVPLRKSITIWRKE